MHTRIQLFCVGVGVILYTISFFAECNNNKYGLNCSETCGKCRDFSQCHYINGSCLNGCDPGFLGERCNLGIVFFACGKILVQQPSIITIRIIYQCFVECSPGFYGVECLQECSSFCKRSRDCNHVTGFCKNGCKTGWQGSDCFKGIFCCCCYCEPFFLFHIFRNCSQNILKLTKILVHILKV